MYLLKKCLNKGFLKTHISFCHNSGITFRLNTYNWVLLCSFLFVFAVNYQCKSDSKKANNDNQVIFRSDMNGNSILRVISDSTLIRKYIVNQAKALGLELESIQIKNIGATIIYNLTINGKEIQTEVMVISSGTHSCSVFLKHNPSNENNASTINNAFEQILNEYNNVESIYAYKIEETNLFDSTILTKVIYLDSTPQLSLVKREILMMEKFVKNQNSNLTNFPMVNVEKSDHQYTLKIGLPIDKDLKKSNGYEIKRMLPGGKFLAIQNLSTNFQNAISTFEQLTNYLDDYGYNSPAIPFISIKDYKNSNDSNNLYNVYYPVF